MRVEWSKPAEAALESYLDYLYEHNPPLSRLARADIRLSTKRLERHPFLGRPSQWSGLRELSVTRWRQVVVYRVDDDRVVVVTMFDARRDRGAINVEE